MKPTRSHWSWSAATRAGSAAAIAALATLSLSACGDDPVSVAPPSPDEAALAEVEGHANGQIARRPFEYSQQWDASGIDYSTICVAEVPDPTTPGASIQVPFGVAHGSGIATHWGRHAVTIWTETCTWDAEAGGIAVRGPARAVVANGDTVWATYEGHWYLSPTGGGDAVASVVFISGTGRFVNVSGEASLYAHDEPDFSGRAWGSGWIAY